MKCIKCGEDIPQGRLKVLPNTKVCVNCSATGTYKGVTTSNGEGDHNWNEIQILTDEQYRKIKPHITNKINSNDSLDLIEEKDIPLKVVIEDEEFESKTDFENLSVE